LPAARDRPPGRDPLHRPALAAEAGHGAEEVPLAAGRGGEGEARARPDGDGGLAEGMRVLFWGTPEFALPALRALAEEGHYVVGVVTQPDRPAGRGRALSVSPIKREALEEGIPVLQPHRARGEEFMEEIRRLRPEVSVVVAYGQSLPEEVLALPERGAINILAALLPELRGAAPVHWAIIHGHGTTGVSIMRMEAGLDSGPVLFQVAEPIRPDES